MSVTKIGGILRTDGIGGLSENLTGLCNLRILSNVLPSKPLYPGIIGNLWGPKRASSEQIRRKVKVTRVSFQG